MWWPTHLNCLPVTAKHVHAHDSFVKIRVRALSNVVIEVLFVSQGVQAFEYKLEECSQVLRTRTGHKDIGIAVRKSCRNSQT